LVIKRHTLLRRSQFLEELGAITVFVALALHVVDNSLNFVGSLGLKMLLHLLLGFVLLLKNIQGQLNNPLKTKDGLTYFSIIRSRALRYRCYSITASTSHRSFSFCFKLLRSGIDTPMFSIEDI